MARRDDREYREYLKEEQRSQRGCIARRMQPDFHHGLLGRFSQKPWCCDCAAAWGSSRASRGSTAGSSPRRHDDVRAQSGARHAGIRQRTVLHLRVPGSIPARLTNLRSRIVFLARAAVGFAEGTEA